MLYIQEIKYILCKYYIKQFLKEIREKSQKNKKDEINSNQENDSDKSKSTLSRPKSLFDKLDVKGYRPIETVEIAEKDPLNHIPYEKIMKEYIYKDI